MNPVPAQFKIPAQPQVNLMPPEVGQRRQRSRQRGGVLAFFIIFVLLLAGLYVGATFLKGQAQQAQAAEEQRTVELQAQIAAFSEVDSVKAELLNAESARQYAAGVEVFWPLIVASLETGFPDSVDVDVVSFEFPAFGSSPAVPESPFARSPIGKINFTVNIATLPEASEIEDQLNRVPFFERARVSAITQLTGAGGGGEVPVVTEGEEEAPVVTGPITVGWAVTGTVDLTYDGLMLRYSPMWFGEPEGTASLKDYYQDFYDALLAGGPLPSTYPPLPEATPPPFVPVVPGTDTGVVQPVVSASPSPEPAA